MLPEEIGAQAAALNTQAAQIQSSAQGLAAAAGNGFHITPEAAATLIKACQDSIHELDDLDQHLISIMQAPMLGESPGAQVIAPFTLQAATDEHGIKRALENLKKTLADMITAYRKASTNYEETEAIISRSLSGQQAHPLLPGPH